MLSEMKTVYTGGVGELVEKKSRFIANVRPVETEEEAAAFIEEMRKKYWDARHNCFAYVIGERNELARFSDDGEPGGTAGKPMLDVLLGEEIHNVAVVVTRYFGGVLLGTGGLVRAYSGAVKAGLANSDVIVKTAGIKLGIGTDYTGLGKIQYLLAAKGIPILDSVYTDAVELTAMVPATEISRIRAELVEATNGRVKLDEKEECSYAVIDGEVVEL